MKLKSTLSVFLLLIFIFFSCKNNKQEYEDYVEKPLPYVEDIVESVVTADTTLMYEMELPIEAARIFEKAGGNYDPTILNPVEKVSDYITSSKAAMNLGLYGVDFSYIRLFNQNEQTYAYMDAMYKLASQLGIPADFFDNASKRVEKYIDNNDSINEISKELFYKTDTYFKENGQGAAAAFMLMGGWIESMFVACKIYENNPKNQEIVNRLIKQKYTLNMLIAFLYNFQEDIVVSKYIIMLKVLKKEFAKISIYQDSNIVNVDTIHKSIPTTDLHFDYNPQTIDDIVKLVFSLREDVIN